MTSDENIQLKMCACFCSPLL